jgi:hypothetical protein
MEMKKLPIFSFILFFAFPLLASANSTGIAKIVKGEVFILKAGELKPLEKNSVIPINSTIVTRDNSIILLDFGSFQKYVPQNTQVKISTQEKAINKNAEILTAIGSVKADDNSEWFSGSNEKLVQDEMAKDFQNKKYLDLIEKFEKNSQIDDPKITFYSATSYLKLGAYNKSSDLYKKLIKWKVYEFYDASKFGLFLSYLGTGNMRGAKNVFLNTQKNSPFYSMIRELLYESDQ